LGKSPCEIYNKFIVKIKMLEDLAQRIRGKRTVIFGVGNPLQGDDAVGPSLVDLLHGRVEATLIDGGDVPENYLSAIKAARPEVVLIVDAVELGAEPGCVAVVDADRLRAIGTFTHNPGLAFLAVFIQDATDAEVLLVGIQPAETHFADKLSKPVEQTLHSLVDTLIKAL
jgi:hydrogenase 3 maturation protease